MKKTERIIRKIQTILLYILPIAIYFSYHPIITLGENETMNLELSILLIWLLVFSVLSIPLDIIWLRNNYLKMAKKRKILLLATVALVGYFLLSTVWSPNKLRAILTSGVLGCIFVSIISIYILLSNDKQKNLKNNLLKTYLVTSCVACLWCWIQCVVDVFSQSSADVFMCAGCKTITFGFPHPNGFTAEPQYMGNLLIIPVLFALYSLFSSSNYISKKQSVIYSIIFSSTLFLTLSRGAIFAFGLGFIVMLIVILIKKTKLKKVFLSCYLVLMSFVFAVIAQGTFSHFSYTNDTFISGVRKSLNQLSLGIIDIPQEVNIEEKNENEISSIHDGYIEASTNERVTLTTASLQLSIANPNNFLFGVGIGGAGTAINKAYEEKFYSQEFLEQKNINRGVLTSSKKNIQNQYVEILLEFGIIGFILFISLIILIIYNLKGNQDFALFFSILISFLVSFVFLSGLPNVIHIYLMFPTLIFLLYPKESRK